MTNGPFCPGLASGIQLKQTSGWFAAGDGFEHATHILSNGAFKLFVYLCLRADRRTGRYETTQNQLAYSLKMSRRIIGTYAAEVQAKRVCIVQMGKNQFARTVFEICDDYWPYKRNELNSPVSAESSLLPTNIDQERSGTDPVTDGPPGGNDNQTESRYIEAVRQAFISVGCTRGVFRSSDEGIARSFYGRGFPLSLVKDALVLGAVRKYASWFNGSSHEMIASLRYFEPLVEELKDTPFPPGYQEYLLRKLKELRKEWLEKCKVCL
jgi:hypothetical protein